MCYISNLTFFFSMCFKKYRQHLWKGRCNMKKQFDEFQKMKLKEMCKTIEDMTYTYINPETKNPTVVPAKHYENILNKTIEQFIEDSLKIEMMNNVFKQMNMLMTEYKQDLIKSLICMDKGLKPTDLSFAETIALNETYHYIDEKMNKEKKKFHILDKEYLDRFDEFVNDTELHKQYLINIDEEKEIEEDMEDDFMLS